eukprot:jgi/Mesvir1/25532/Mv01779-RA.1
MVQTGSEKVVKAILCPPPPEKPAQWEFFRTVVHPASWCYSGYHFSRSDVAKLSKDSMYKARHIVVHVASELSAECVLLKAPIARKGATTTGAVPGALLFRVNPDCLPRGESPLALSYRLRATVAHHVFSGPRFPLASVSVVRESRYDADGALADNAEGAIEVDLPAQALRELHDMAGPDGFLPRLQRVVQQLVRKGEDRFLERPWHSFCPRSFLERQAQQMRKRSAITSWRERNAGVLSAAFLICSHGPNGFLIVKLSDAKNDVNSGATSDAASDANSGADASRNVSRTPRDPAQVAPAQVVVLPGTTRPTLETAYFDIDWTHHRFLLHRASSSPPSADPPTARSNPSLGTPSSGNHAGHPTPNGSHNSSEATGGGNSARLSAREHGHETRRQWGRRTKPATVMDRGGQNEAVSWPLKCPLTGATWDTQAEVSSFDSALLDFLFPAGAQVRTRDVASTTLPVSSSSSQGNHASRGDHAGLNALLPTRAPGSASPATAAAPSPWVDPYEVAQVLGYAYADSVPEEPAAASSGDDPHEEDALSQLLPISVTGRQRLAVALPVPASAWPGPPSKDGHGGHLSGGGGTSANGYHPGGASLSPRDVPPALPAAMSEFLSACVAALRSEDRGERAAALASLRSLLTNVTCPQEPLRSALEGGGLGRLQASPQDGKPGGAAKKVGNRNPGRGGGGGGASARDGLSQETGMAGSPSGPWRHNLCVVLGLVVDHLAACGVIGALLSVLHKQEDASFSSVGASGTELRMGAGAMVAGCGSDADWNGDMAAGEAGCSFREEAGWSSCEATSLAPGSSSNNWATSRGDKGLTAQDKKVPMSRDDKSLPSRDNKDVEHVQGGRHESTGGLAIARQVADCLSALILLGGARHGMAHKTLLGLLFQHGVGMGVGNGAGVAAAGLGRAVKSPSSNAASVGSAGDWMAIPSSSSAAATGVLPSSGGGDGSWQQDALQCLGSLQMVECLLRRHPAGVGQALLELGGMDALLECYGMLVGLGTHALASYQGMHALPGASHAALGGLQHGSSPTTAPHHITHVISPMATCMVQTSTAEGHSSGPVPQGAPSRALQDLLSLVRQQRQVLAHVGGPNRAHPCYRGLHGAAAGTAAGRSNAASGTKGVASKGAAESHKRQAQRPADDSVRRITLSEWGGDGAPSRLAIAADGSKQGRGTSSDWGGDGRQGHGVLSASPAPSSSGHVFAGHAQGPSSAHDGVTGARPQAGERAVAQEGVSDEPDWEASGYSWASGGSLKGSLKGHAGSGSRASQPGAQGSDRPAANSPVFAEPKRSSRLSDCTLSSLESTEWQEAGSEGSSRGSSGGGQRGSQVPQAAGAVDRGGSEPAQGLPGGRPANAYPAATSAMRMEVPNIAGHTPRGLFETGASSGDPETGREMGSGDRYGPGDGIAYASASFRQGGGDGGDGDDVITPMVGHQAVGGRRESVAGWDDDRSDAGDVSTRMASHRSTHSSDTGIPVVGDSSGGGVAGDSSGGGVAGDSTSGGAGGTKAAVVPRLSLPPEPAVGSLTRSSRRTFTTSYRASQPRPRGSFGGGDALASASLRSPHTVMSSHMVGSSAAAPAARPGRRSLDGQLGDRPPQASLGAVSLGAVSLGAVSLGAASLGAASVGAASVGAASLGARGGRGVDRGGSQAGSWSVSNSSFGTSAVASMSLSDGSVGVHLEDNDEGRGTRARMGFRGVEVDEEDVLEEAGLVGIAPVGVPPGGHGGGRGGKPGEDGAEGGRPRRGPYSQDDDDDDDGDNEEDDPDDTGGESGSLVLDDPPSVMQAMVTQARQGSLSGRGVLESASRGSSPSDAPSAIGEDAGSGGGALGRDWGGGRPWSGSSSSVVATGGGGGAADELSALGQQLGQLFLVRDLGALMAHRRQKQIAASAGGQQGARMSQVPSWSSAPARPSLSVRVPSHREVPSLDASQHQGEFGSIMRAHGAGHGMSSSLVSTSHVAADPSSRANEDAIEGSTGGQDGPRLKKDGPNRSSGGGGGVVPAVLSGAACDHRGPVEGMCCHTRLEVQAGACAGSLVAPPVASAGNGAAWASATDNPSHATDDLVDGAAWEWAVTSALQATLLGALLQLVRPLGARGALVAAMDAEAGGARSTVATVFRQRVLLMLVKGLLEELRQGGGQEGPHPLPGRVSDQAARKNHPQRLAVGGEGGGALGGHEVIRHPSSLGVTAGVSAASKHSGHAGALMSGASASKKHHAAKRLVLPLLSSGEEDHPMTPPDALHHVSLPGFLSSPSAASEGSRVNEDGFGGHVGEEAFVMSPMASPMMFLVAHAGSMRERERDRGQHPHAHHGGSHGNSGHVENIGLMHGEFRVGEELEGDGKEGLDGVLAGGPPQQTLVTSASITDGRQAWGALGREHRGQWGAGRHAAWDTARRNTGVSLWRWPGPNARAMCDVVTAYALCRGGASHAHVTWALPPGTEGTAIPLAPPGQVPPQGVARENPGSNTSVSRGEEAAEEARTALLAWSRARLSALLASLPGQGFTPSLVLPSGPAMGEEPSGGLTVTRSGQHQGIGPHGNATLQPSPYTNPHGNVHSGMYTHKKDHRASSKQGGGGGGGGGMTASPVPLGMPAGAAGLPWMSLLPWVAQALSSFSQGSLASLHGGGQHIVPISGALPAGHSSVSGRNVHRGGLAHSVPNHQGGSGVVASSLAGPYGANASASASTSPGQGLDVRALGGRGGAMPSSSLDHLQALLRLARWCVGVASAGCDGRQSCPACEALSHSGTGAGLLTTHGGSAPNDDNGLAHVSTLPPASCTCGYSLITRHGPSLMTSNHAAGCGGVASSSEGRGLSHRGHPSGSDATCPENGSDGGGGGACDVCRRHGGNDMSTSCLHRVPAEVLGALLVDPLLQAQRALAAAVERAGTLVAAAGSPGACASGEGADVDGRGAGSNEVSLMMEGTKGQGSEAGGGMRVTALFGIQLANLEEEREAGSLDLDGEGTGRAEGAGDCSQAPKETKLNEAIKEVGGAAAGAPRDTRKGPWRAVSPGVLRATDAWVSACMALARAGASTNGVAGAELAAFQAMSGNGGSEGYRQSLESAGPPTLVEEVLATALLSQEGVLRWIRGYLREILFGDRGATAGVPAGSVRNDGPEAHKSHTQLREDPQSGRSDEDWGTAEANRAGREEGVPTRDDLHPAHARAGADGATGTAGTPWEGVRHYPGSRDRDASPPNVHEGDGDHGGDTEPVLTSSELQGFQMRVLALFRCLAQIATRVDAQQQWRRQQRRRVAAEASLQAAAMSCARGHGGNPGASQGSLFPVGDSSRGAPSGDAGEGDVATSSHTGNRSVPGAPGGPPVSASIAGTRSPDYTHRLIGDAGGGLSIAAEGGDPAFAVNVDVAAAAAATPPRPLLAQLRFLVDPARGYLPRLLSGITWRHEARAHEAAGGEDAASGAGRSSHGTSSQDPSAGASATSEVGGSGDGSRGSGSGQEDAKLGTGRGYAQSNRCLAGGAGTGVGADGSGSGSTPGAPCRVPVRLHLAALELLASLFELPGCPFAGARDCVGHYVRFSFLRFVRLYSSPVPMPAQVGGWPGAGAEAESRVHGVRNSSIVGTGGVAGGSTTGHAISVVQEGGKSGASSTGIVSPIGCLSRSGGHVGCRCGLCGAARSACPIPGAAGTPWDNLDDGLLGLWPSAMDELASVTVACRLHLRVLLALARGRDCYGSHCFLTVHALPFLAREVSLEHDVATRKPGQLLLGAAGALSDFSLSRPGTAGSRPATATMRLSTDLRGLGGGGFKGGVDGDSHGKGEVEGVALLMGGTGEAEGGIGGGGEDVDVMQTREESGSWMPAELTAGSQAGKLVVSDAVGGEEASRPGEVEGDEPCLTEPRAPPFPMPSMPKLSFASLNGAGKDVRTVPDSSGSMVPVIATLNVAALPGAPTPSPKEAKEAGPAKEPSGGDHDTSGDASSGMGVLSPSIADTQRSASSSSSAASEAQTNSSVASSQKSPSAPPSPLGVATDTGPGVEETSVGVPGPRPKIPQLSMAGMLVKQAPMAAASNGVPAHDVTSGHGNNAGAATGGGDKATGVVKPPSNGASASPLAAVASPGPPTASLRVVPKLSLPTSAMKSVATGASASMNANGSAGMNLSLAQPRDSVGQGPVPALPFAGMSLKLNLPLGALSAVDDKRLGSGRVHAVGGSGGTVGGLAAGLEGGGDGDGGGSDDDSDHDATDILYDLNARVEAELEAEEAAEEAERLERERIERLQGEGEEPGTAGEGEKGNESSSRRFQYSWKGDSAADTGVDSGTRGATGEGVPSDAGFLSAAEGASTSRRSPGEIANGDRAGLPLSDTGKSTIYGDGGLALNSVAMGSLGDASIAPDGGHRGEASTGETGTSDGPDPETQRPPQVPKLTFLGRLRSLGRSKDKGPNSGGREGRSPDRGNGEEAGGAASSRGTKSKSPGHSSSRARQGVEMAMGNPDKPDSPQNSPVPRNALLGARSVSDQLPLAPGGRALLGPPALALDGVGHLPSRVPSSLRTSLHLGPETVREDGGTGGGRGGGGGMSLARSAGSSTG